MRVAIHTRLKPEGVAGYEQAHDHIPPAIPELLRAGGCTGWTIWRNGVDLFHLVECEDWEALTAFLADQEADHAWQAQVGVFRDFTLLGGDTPLPVIFELPAAGA
ncbi:L-rhamnose mutarotase [Catenulispora yoronensis]|uniref:L-rhamnose mutarotase n=1 Tax=Catenulispora yoronensis TaxID=450799 RepID=A0ABN2ULV3_9ACTN